MSIADEFTITARATTGKDPRRREVRVKRYVGGWNVTLAIAVGDAQAAKSSVALAPDEALRLASALIDAAKAAAADRDAAAA